MQIKFDLKILKLSLISFFIFFSSTNINASSSDFDDNFTFEDYDDDLYIDDSILDDPYLLDENLRADDFLRLLQIVLRQIEEPIWQHTKPPKGRDVLYLIPHKFTAIKYGRLDLNLLYNQTHKMNVTLRDLINLDSKVVKVMDLLKLLIQNQNITSEQASQLVPLFTKAIIQERKGAALLQAGVSYKYFNIQLHTSFQASERNFWISKRDLQIIEDMFEGEDQTFDKKELYKIKYGLGDTRLKLGLNTLNTGGFQFDVGFEGILPTAQKQELPNVDNSYLPYDEPSLKKWMIENLRAIRDNLINPQLGNNGHFGFGFFIESEIDLFHESLKLWNRFSIDNIFEANEDRLILFKQTITNKELAEIPINDPELPNAISRFIRENVFPPPFNVTIKPGSILSFITNFSFNINKKWLWGVGYDLYIQDAEDIKKINDTKVNPYELRIEGAQTPRAIQHKIFSETNYSIKKRSYDLIVGLGADMTFSSRNIGRDWTVYLRIGAGF